MVLCASVRLFDDKTANKWRAVVRAERTNGEQSAGAPDKQDGFAACLALQPGSFGKCRERNDQGEDGSGQCCCFGVHVVLLRAVVAVAYIGRGWVRARVCLCGCITGVVVTLKK